MNFSLRFGNDFIRFRISSRVSFARFGRSILSFFKAFVILVATMVAHWYHTGRE